MLQCRHDRLPRPRRPQIAPRLPHAAPAAASAAGVLHRAGDPRLSGPAGLARREHAGCWRRSTSPPTAFLAAMWIMMARASTAGHAPARPVRGRGPPVVLALSAAVGWPSCSRSCYELHGIRGPAAGRRRASASRWGRRHHPARPGFSRTPCSRCTTPIPSTATPTAPPTPRRAASPSPAARSQDYWDFLYFSFTIGMTFQVSDVQIEGHRAAPHRPRPRRARLLLQRRGAGPHHQHHRRADLRGGVARVAAQRREIAFHEQQAPADTCVPVRHGRRSANQRRLRSRALARRRRPQVGQIGAGRVAAVRAGRGGRAGRLGRICPATAAGMLEAVPQFRN